MKKTFTVAFLILIVIACHRKTVPAASTVTTTETNAETPKADEAHTEMVVQGKTVFVNRCGRCHALKTVENYTADRWTNILKSMIPKAKLNDIEAQQVTAYVMENAKK